MFCMLLILSQVSLIWGICFLANHIQTVNSLYSIESVNTKTYLRSLGFSLESPSSQDSVTF